MASEPKPVQLPPSASASTPAVIDAGRRFGGAKEVQIELQGVRYRLRITRRGKLILQK
jgi:hemin uptake protein HemP